MAASKFAEKLIILCDHATGIQCRLYQLVDYKRPQLFAKDTEIEKFAKLFLKKFPEFPDTLNKEKSNDVFKKRAPEITTALNDFYCTFLEVMNFTEEAWKLLTELAASIQEFKLELNIDLLSYYFHLFTRYIQIHFLVSLIDTPQLFLASFARAFQHTSGNTEPNFFRIAKYLEKYKPHPLKKLQEDAAAISLCIGNTLLTFLPILMKYSTVSGFSQGGKLINVLQEEPRALTLPVNEKLQMEVLHLANMRSWVLWGFLICPAELARPGALDLLSICLKETFLLQIFRDKSISIHKEFDDIIDYKSSTGNFKLSKHKKVFKDAYADDEGTRKFHLDLRTFVRTELEIAEKFFQEVPSCIAPKLSMLFTLLNLARNEVVWFFRHQHFIPFKTSSSKVKGLIYDPQLPCMIDLTMRLVKMIESNKREIQEYYVDALTKFDAANAKKICDTFLATIHNPQLSALVHAITDHLHDRTAADNLESIRLNWYRISAAVNHQQSGIPIHTTTAFSNLMNTIVNHSRNIDTIDTQLKTHASFAGLFFYKNEIFESLKATLQSVDGSAVYCVAYPALLASALHSIHRLCPDEQAQIGKEVITTGDAFIRLIVNVLESSVQGVINNTMILRSRTNYNAVLLRIQHVNAMALNPSLTPMVIPGEESQFEQRRDKIIQDLSIYHKTISDITASIAKNDILVLYNIEFVLREYIQDAIANNIRAAIIQLAIKGRQISKPTTILNRLKDTIYSFASIERSLGISVHDIAREVLLSEFAPQPEELNALAATAPVASASSSSSAIVETELSAQQKNEPIILNIAAWYSNLFSKDLSLHGIVYSSLKRCFISRGGVSNSHSLEGLEFERYTDVTELRALATLLGPAGIAVIDRALIKIVAKQAQKVKEVLVQNQGLLVNMSGRFTEQSVWSENIVGLKDMDVLCTATTITGCILHFRNLLRNALNTVTQRRSPYVHQAVQLAHRTMHEGVVVDDKLRGMDQAASDIGLDVGEADHALRAALAPLKTSVADLHAFSYLPELYGLMYLSQRWRTAVFSVDIEGHTNNNHTMALGIRHFLSQFARIQVKEGAPAIEIEKKIVFDLERFIKSSAFTMLHMKVVYKDANANHAYPLPAIMIFLEQCILAFGGRVEMSVLETVFPFSILRANYIQLYNRDASHNYVPSDDSSSSSSSSAAAAE